MSDYRPGDVVNGWVLGRDLQWHPAPVAPAGPDPFDFGTAGTRRGVGAGTGTPTGVLPSWDTRTTRVTTSFDDVATPAPADPFGSGEWRTEEPKRSRKGVALGLGGAFAALIVGFAMGSGGSSAADVASAAPVVTPTVTVTVTSSAEPAPAVTVTETATATVTRSASAPQGFADLGSESDSGSSSSGSSSSSDDNSDSSAADAYYKNCTAARAAGAAPLRSGEPGYRSALDRDGDGVACES